MGWRDTLDSLYTNRDWKAASGPERDHAVTDVIRVSSLGAAAVTVTPVPLADLVVALPIQAAMVVAIGHIRGRNIGREQSFTIMRELTTVVGTHVLAQRAFVALSRLLFPGMAGFLMAPWTFGVTYAMGRVAELYFVDPNAPAERFQVTFKDALKEAKRVFSKDLFVDFLKRTGKDAQDFAAKETPSANAQPGSSPGAAAPPPAAEPKVVDADWEDAGSDKRTL